jgi:hypothetical protein
MSRFVIAWTSGHTPPKTLYLHQKSKDSWGCTEDRGLATRYRTAQTAWRAWREKHMDPEQYRNSVTSGQVRVEKAEEPELFV